MSRKLLKLLLCIVIVFLFVSSWIIWDLNRTYSSDQVSVEMHKTDRCSATPR